MPAVQKDVLTLNPNKLDLQLVATYPRTVQANLARVWENVLDWEHLPHLHDASFSYCELEEAGRWGWRVWSDSDHGGHIELAVDTHCYVARSYAGGEQFSEIWTHLTEQGDCTDIRVEFYSTGVADENRESIGEFYLGLYRVLWDEDEAMMQQRQQRLEQPRAAGTEINLGKVAQLRQSAPLRFELNRREYLLNEQAEGWVATPTICPHLLGPLAAAEQPGQMRCPWHGYVFDLQTGKCVTPASARCSLGLPPEISVQDGQLIVSAR
jgi:nitrite reductase/ring-hydroxylating ferredoxin subunit